MCHALQAAPSKHSLFSYGRMVIDPIVYHSIPIKKGFLTKGCISNIGSLDPGPVSPHRLLRGRNFAGKQLYV